MAGQGDPCPANRGLDALCRLRESCIGGKVPWRSAFIGFHTPATRSSEEPLWAARAGEPRPTDPGRLSSADFFGRARVLPSRPEGPQSGRLRWTFALPMGIIRRSTGKAGFPTRQNLVGRGSPITHPQRQRNQCVGRYTTASNPVIQTKRYKPGDIQACGSASSDPQT